MPTETTAAPAWATRDYRPNDAHALFVLWQEAYARSHSDTAMPTLDEASFSQRLGEAWVRIASLENGEIVGFAAIMVPGHIEWLATAHGHERQGIGSALLEDLDFLAGAMGGKHISADVPSAAEAFFAHRGFTGSGRMEKPLA